MQPLVAGAPGCRLAFALAAPAAAAGPLVSDALVLAALPPLAHVKSLHQIHIINPFCITIALETVVTAA